jgi:hypothetical protein
MIHQLPDEVLNIIFSKSCLYPSDFIKIKGVNKHFRDIINYKKNIFLDKENNYENDINRFCNILTPIETFTWFFENKIRFTLINIKELIISDRCDVFKKGYFDKNFLDIVFNRFHISLDNYCDNFTITECYNPLIIAGTYNRINIIKLLVEQSTTGNPYIKSIPELLKLSIKYNHKRLLNYVLLKHYDSIKDELYSKLINIIYRVGNCEDILFYIINVKGCSVESKHYQGLINKGYNDLLLFLLKKNKLNNNFLKVLLSQSVSVKNVIVFDYLFKQIKDDYSKKEFTNMIFDQNWSEEKDDFLEYIIYNYHNYFEEKSKIIKLSFINDIRDNLIINLINNNYYISNEILHLGIDKKRYKISSIMCDKLSQNS